MMIGGEHLYESTNQGQVVQDLSAGPFGVISGAGIRVSAIALGRYTAAKKAAYVFFWNQPWVRTDAAVWSSRSAPGFRMIQAVETDPENWQTAIAVDGAAVWLTIDGGSHWQDITGSER